MTDGSGGALGVLTAPLVHARLDEALGKDYASGVVGIHARPVWSGPAGFDHRGAPVQVVTCSSSLAVRDAMLGWPGTGWLVIVTDRTPEDLGDGILAHLIGSRLRTPDEWEALRQRFNATGIDPALQAEQRSRQVATGLLAVEPAEGWPPAPGGVLTRDHVMAAVFHHHLGLDVDSGPMDSDTVEVGSSESGPVDATSVLDWTMRSRAATTLTDLRQRGGDALADAALAWAAERLGMAGGPVLPLFTSGRLADVVPLGIVVGLLTEPNLDAREAEIAQAARIRLEAPLGGAAPSGAALTAWAQQTRAVVAPATVLDRADHLLVTVQADSLAGRSDLLPSGLRARLSGLAESVRTAAEAAVARAGDDPDAALISPEQSARIERAWTAVAGHSVVRAPRGRTDSRVRPFLAAVRLARWLAQPATAPSGTVADLVGRHRDTDAWVDISVNDAATGTGDPGDGVALSAILRATQLRRDAHDTEFAAALAALTRDDPTEPGVRYIEDILAEDVAPIVSPSTPVLLLVLDGMSVATAIEVIEDAAGRGWSERSTSARRDMALAVLPTLTSVSRTSLFSGQLTTGGQPQELAGVAEFGRARGLGTVLFHKKLLDSSRPGFAVSDRVGAALDNTAGMPLVACVLNTVDDALDRSDPGGTDWTMDAIKHLRPLLERARVAGRTVILTADHGHIVERRLGTQRNCLDATSNRSRPATPPAGADEVLVEGRRVVAPDGRVVLAVNDRLRYGPLKAGYHGGASPAEVIVPVCYLVSGIAADSVPNRLQLLGDQTPPWWETPSAEVLGAVFPTVVGRGPVSNPRREDVGQNALPGMEISAAESPPRSIELVVEAVLTSSVYTAQSQRAGRAQPGRDEVRTALLSLLADPGRRRPMDVLVGHGSGATRARGAFTVFQRLLNVEGYQVLALDSDGVTAVLDEDLLCEQYGITR